MEDEILPDVINAMIEFQQRISYLGDCGVNKTYRINVHVEMSKSSDAESLFHVVLFYYSSVII